MALCLETCVVRGKTPHSEHKWKAVEKLKRNSIHSKDAFDSWLKFVDKIKILRGKACYCAYRTYVILLFAFRWRRHVHSTVVQYNLLQPFCKIGKMGGKFWELIYFEDHGPKAPLDMPMKLWQLHSTMLVLDNDYRVFASLLSTQNFNISTWRVLCQSRYNKGIRISPVATGGLWWAQLPTESSKTPKLKHETLQTWWNFWQIWMSNPSCMNVKSPAQT